MAKYVQQNLFSTPQVIEPPIRYWPKFFKKDEADEFLHLSLRIRWLQHQMTIFGKTADLPRLEAMFGDSEDFEYQYSGQVSLKASPWPQWLKQIRGRIEQATQHQYALAIGSQYRSGQDSIGYHADDEPNLGERPAIASLSLGTTRTFLIKPKEKGSKATKLELSHGSLLLMKPGCQESWVHSVPKTTRSVSTRINWTFRPHQNLKA